MDVTDGGSGATVRANGSVAADGVLHVTTVLPAQNGHDRRPRLQEVVQAAEIPRPAPAALTCSVVIPTLNEAGNIVTVLRQLEHFDDIVLVDGLSDDGTVQLARATRPDITVI